MAIVIGTNNNDFIHEPQGVTDEGDTILGQGGNDTIYGLGGGDNISGGDGNDTMFGGAGDDTIAGGANTDMIDGGIGADAIDGGGGLDTVIYTASAFAVTVNLATGQGQGGDAEGDTFINVEHVTGSIHADTLTGSDGNNTLYGYNGNDTLRGGLGTDILWGGDGQDTATYSDSASGVIVNLLTGTGSGGSAANDTLAEMEHLVGSQHNDGLSGDNVANILSGLSGNDFLIGNGGTDTLFGGFGNDTLWGGLGPDVLNGGAGVDTAAYSDSTTGVVVSLVTGVGAFGFADGDTLTEIENLTGSDHPDSLFGDNGANLLRGSDGDDTLHGNGGNDAMHGDEGDDTLLGGSGTDTLTGGLGADTLEGGSGVDTAVYTDSTTGVVVSLVTGVGSYGFADGDTLDDIENLTGSAHADSLFGDGIANLLSGLNGDDTLNAGNGNDVLNGGAGDDAMTGGFGNDTYYVDAAGDTVTELAGQGTDVVYSSVGLYMLSAEVENLAWNGAGAFTGMGNGLANKIYGGTAGDYLIGFGGDDILFGGGGGPNALQGGTGSDKYIVEAIGDSLIEFAGEGVNDEAQTNLGSFILPNHVERLVYSGAGSFTGTGNSGNNVFVGGAGVDNWTGGGGVDRFAMSGPSGADIVHDFDAANASAGHDIIDLTGRGLVFGDLAVTDTVGGVTIGIPGGDAVHLIGGSAATIDAGDFWF